MDCSVDKPSDIIPIVIGCVLGRDSTLSTNSRDCHTFLTNSRDCHTFLTNRKHCHTSYQSLTDNRFVFSFLSNLWKSQQKSSNNPGLGIRSFRSNQMSDCELFNQITQDKWAIVSELLRSLRGNERPWANRSGPSRQMSDHERCAQVAQRKWANERFAQQILAKKI